MVKGVSLIKRVVKGVSLIKRVVKGVSLIKRVVKGVSLIKREKSQEWIKDKETEGWIGGAREKEGRKDV